MDKLSIFFNSKCKLQRDSLCKEAGTTYNYVQKVLSNHRLGKKGGNFGSRICAELERVSCGAVTRCDMRPKDWHLIWPELTDKESH